MLCSFDFETTGLTPGTHGILSLAVAREDGSVFHRRIFPHPEAEYQQAAIDKNGYNSGLWLATGVTLMQAMRELREFLPRDVKPVAHNAGFDAIWFAFAERLSGITILPKRTRWSCSCIAYAFLMDAGVLPRASASLDSLGSISGYWPSHPRAEKHDALEDALCCLHSYQWLINIVAPKRTFMQRLKAAFPLCLFSFQLSTFSFLLFHS